jgi:hypothetical protein
MYKASNYAELFLVLGCVFDDDTKQYILNSYFIRISFS